MNSKSFGLEDAHMDEHGYVMATLPANTDKELPVAGFLAHVDKAVPIWRLPTSGPMIENYSGGVLNRELDVYESGRFSGIGKIIKAKRNYLATPSVTKL